MESNEYPESPVEDGSDDEPVVKHSKLSTVATVLAVIVLIVATALYAIFTGRDESDRITGVVEDSAEEFLNGDFRPYLDDIIKKCGLNDLTAEFTVDYDSIQKLTLSIDFNINVSFFSDEIDDYYCENENADKAAIDELRSVMRNFSEEAGVIDYESFEFATSSDDYIRLHLYVDYHTITTFEGRKYYYIDTDTYEELTIDGTEILYNEYTDTSF